MIEKNNKNQKKEENCPLCKVSEETLKNLKEAGKEKNKQKPVKDNEK